jgi:two-component system, cell cycle sensor histidine kinase and response regulator CckA
MDKRIGRANSRKQKRAAVAHSFYLFLRNIILRYYKPIFIRRIARVRLRLRLLHDGTKGHAFFTVDPAGLVTSWNRGAQRVFGYGHSDVLGKHFSLFFTLPDTRIGIPDKLLQQACTGALTKDNGWQVRKDGTLFFAEGLLTLLGKGVSREFGRQTHDVTQRRNEEETLRHTQKLESLGVLTSGIAHDFNNLLCGMLSGVSSAIANLPANHPSSRALALAEQACEKAADLTHQMLAYAGQGKFIVTRFDLSALIQDMVVLLESSIPKAVKLELALEPNLPWIEADASQIQQVVMNLVINGAESMVPEGGTLRVSTGSAPAYKSIGCNDGVGVCMEVRDSGSGMTDATLARIFDPFFTTKFTGRGLGLAAVSGIVRSHEGRMHVESILGKGSIFRTCFPGVDRRAEVKETSPALSNEPDSGLVLVVDDEPGLRALAKIILEKCGYTVLIASDGKEAVEIFRQQSDSITAILLDMTMPVMNGEEAFHLLRAIRADVPIVISTGYNEGATRELFGAGAIVGFVQKPYTAARLAERIRTTSHVLKIAGASG